MPAARLQTLLVQQAAMFLAWKCQICFKLAGKEADFKQRLLLCLPAQQTLVCGGVGWSQIRSMPAVVQERVLGHRDTSGDKLFYEPQGTEKSRTPKSAAVPVVGICGSPPPPHCHHG